MLHRTRRVAVTIIVLVATSLVLGGCQTEASNGSSSGSPARVRVSGSGTCLPLLRILTDEYSADHGDVEFVYLPGLHSGGGIRGVANDDLEIGSVSRELTAEEEELGLRYVRLSDDGLVIAVHPSVELDGLTSEQVREIYRGTHDNWQELGGNDMPITILDRNEDESAKIILREYVLGNELEVSTKAVNLFYEPDMVEGLERTPGAIGYFSLGLGLSEEVPVRYLELDGVEASVSNIENGAYTIVRPLGVVVKEPIPAEIDGFLNWAQSDEARQLMRAKGFAPAGAER